MGVWSREFKSFVVSVFHRRSCVPNVSYKKQESAQGKLLSLLSFYLYSPPCPLRVAIQALLAEPVIPT